MSEVVSCPNCDRQFRNERGYHIHYSTTHGEPYPWESDATYGQHWGDVREKALDRDSRRCRSCGDHSSDERFVELHVHHVDGDKQNHSLDNLRTLCETCHLRYELHSIPLVLSSAESASPSYIAQRDDYSRQNITNRLGRLVEHGYVRKLAPGLYELVEDPRDG